MFAMRFVPLVVCEITASRLATGRAHVDNGKETFQSDVKLFDHLVGRRCARLLLAEKLLLHFRYLASIRRADSERVTVPHTVRLE
jgi:hypothetical protein